MKNRSYNSSLTAGYKLYTDNFKKILKASWLWAILYAAACSLLGTLSSIELPRFVLMTMASTSSEMPLYENPEYITICLSFLAVIIIGGIIEITFYSSGVSLLRQHQENASIPVPNTWFYFAHENHAGAEQRDGGGNPERFHDAIVCRAAVQLVLRQVPVEALVEPESRRVRNREEERPISL